MRRVEPDFTSAQPRHSMMGSESRVGVRRPGTCMSRADRVPLSRFERGSEMQTQAFVIICETLENMYPVGWTSHPGGLYGHPDQGGRDRFVIRDLEAPLAGVPSRHAHTRPSPTANGRHRKQEHSKRRYGKPDRHRRPFLIIAMFVALFMAIAGSAAAGAAGWTPWRHQPQPTSAGTISRPCSPSPHSCGYPDATNTGVTPGVRLTKSGSVRVTQDYRVVQNLTINNGTIDIDGEERHCARRPHNSRCAPAVGDYRAARSIGNDRARRHLRS